MLLAPANGEAFLGKTVSSAVFLRFAGNEERARARELACCVGTRCAGGSSYTTISRAQRGTVHSPYRLVN